MTGEPLDPCILHPSIFLATLRLPHLRSVYDYDYYAAVQTNAIDPFR